MTRLSEHVPTESTGSHGHAGGTKVTWDCLRRTLGGRFPKLDKKLLELLREVGIVKKVGSAADRGVLSDNLYQKSDFINKAA